MQTISATERHSVSQPKLAANFTARHGFDLATKTSADSPYTVVLSDRDKVLLLNATSGSITVNLPPVASVPVGVTFLFKRIDASGNTVTIDGDGAEAIDGGGTATLLAHTSMRIVNDGTAWRQI
jgi:hypothetical protein